MSTGEEHDIPSAASDVKELKTPQDVSLYGIIRLYITARPGPVMLRFQGSPYGSTMYGISSHNVCICIRTANDVRLVTHASDLSITLYMVNTNLRFVSLSYVGESLNGSREPLLPACRSSTSGLGTKYGSRRTRSTNNPSWGSGSVSGLRMKASSRRNMQRRNL